MKWAILGFILVLGIGWLKRFFDELDAAFGDADRID